MRVVIVYCVFFFQREISEVNKGRKMLEKMGWKKGEGLGKEGTGMKAPVRTLEMSHWLICFCIDVFQSNKLN